MITIPRSPRTRGARWVRCPRCWKCSWPSIANFDHRGAGTRRGPPPPIRWSRTSTGTASSACRWRPPRNSRACSRRRPGTSRARYGRARSRGGPGDRAVPGRRSTARQRDGAARPQLRSLDRRGGQDQPVREPPPSGHRPSAGPDRSGRRQRDGEPDRDDAGARVGRRRAGRALHDYGKQPRPGRKLGHVTVV